tara:strand:+ start:4362 stop:5834 length:1473 start_codon:yes stop_codon:yes gene_type:complete
MSRDKVLKFLDDKNTYNILMGILSDKLNINSNSLKDYPTHSFIAGGAIANTIYYLLNRNKFESPIINDIDLFCVKNGNHQTKIENGFSINSKTKSAINLDDYGRVWRGSFGETLSMVKSDRTGILNKISIDVKLKKDSCFSVTKYYLDIINSFDLNCCSVGVDRVNEKIVYNNKFIDFLVTDKIEVTSIEQPIQTAFRLKKKIKELKTDSTNFLTEMSLIQHSAIFKNKKFIGPLWVSKIKKDLRFVRKYFRGVDERGVDSTQYLPFDGAKEYVIKDFKLEKNVEKFYFNNYGSLISFWDLFVRKKNVNNLNKVLKFYNKVGLIEKNKRTIKNLFYKRKFKFSKLKEIYHPNTVDHLNLLNYLNICPNYLDCEFTVEDLIYLNNFNKMLKENWFEDTSVFLVNNVKDHVKLILELDSIFNKKGGFNLNLFNKVVSKQWVSNDISSLTYEKKLKAIKKILNNLWIKNGDNLKHKFTNVKKIKTIDLNDVIF